MRNLLEAIFGPINSALGSIPVEFARWFIVGFLLLALAAALSLKRDYVFRGAKHKVWYADLRLWAVIVILPYLLLYLLL